NSVVAFNHVYFLFTGGNSAPGGSDVFHFLPTGFEDAIGLQIDHATLDFSQFTPSITVNLPDASGFNGSVPGAIGGFANLTANLTVIGTNGNDTFNVPALQAAAPITIYAGPGTSAINVGAPGNTLDPLAGSLTIHGAGVTSVTFNNQGANPAVGHG